MEYEATSEYSSGPCLFDDDVMRQIAGNDDVAMILAERSLQVLADDPTTEIVKAGAQTPVDTREGRVVKLGTRGPDGMRYNFRFQPKPSGACYVRAEAHGFVMRLQPVREWHGVR